MDINADTCSEDSYVYEEQYHKLSPRSIVIKEKLEVDDAAIHNNCEEMYNYFTCNLCLKVLKEPKECNKCQTAFCAECIE